MIVSSIFESNRLPFKNDHYRDLEPLITQHKRDLVKTPFIQRMIAFSISGTYVVDLKDTSQQSRFSSKLQPDFLSNFFANLIKMQISTPIDPEAQFLSSREEFQKTLTIELFNYQVSWISMTIYIGKHCVQRSFWSCNNGNKAC